MHLTKSEGWVCRNVSIIKEQKTEAKLSKENLKFLHGGKAEYGGEAEYGGWGKLNYGGGGSWIMGGGGSWM